MSRRYISVNILPDQQDFIKLLDEYEIDIFSIDQIENQIGKKFSKLNEVIENLIDKEFLSRIERGKYARANFRNELVIGTFITKKSAVAYWTALNTHGLTEQFSNTIFIQTTCLKRNKSIFGTPYKFVKISPNKRIGVIRQGYGSHSYPITNIEKTMVDCFDLPQYSGGYAEMIRAFAQARLRSEKMIDYCRAINQKAATKRMGYLAEFLEKKELKAFIRFAKDQVNPKYNLFDPFGQDTGEFVSEWKLRLNMSQDELFGIAQKQY